MGGLLGGLDDEGRSQIGHPELDEGLRFLVAAEAQGRARAHLRLGVLWRWAQIAPGLGPRSRVLAAQEQGAYPPLAVARAAWGLALAGAFALRGLAHHTSSLPKGPTTARTRVHGVPSMVPSMRRANEGGRGGAHSPNRG